MFLPFFFFSFFYLPPLSTPHRSAVLFIWASSTQLKIFSGGINSDVYFMGFSADIISGGISKTLPWACVACERHLSLVLTFYALKD